MSNKRSPPCLSVKQTQSIETTIERDKKGGSVSLLLPLIVLCGGFPPNFVSDLETAQLSDSTHFGGRETLDGQANRVNQQNRVVIRWISGLQSRGSVVSVLHIKLSKKLCMSTRKPRITCYKLVLISALYYILNVHSFEFPVLYKPSAEYLWTI